MKSDFFSGEFEYFKKHAKCSWIPLLCFFLTFLWFGIFAVTGVDPHHDGIMLKPAVDVANGQVLFRDTFTQYGALTTFIQALAIKIFGPYLIVIRLATVLFYALSVVLLYYIWKNFISTFFFWVLYGLFLVLAPFYDWTFNPWSSVYALFFLLLGNLSMIGFIKSGTEWRLWTAGASMALAFWCRQPVGIVMLLALSIYFLICVLAEHIAWRRLLRQFSICILSCILISLPFLIYLLAYGALRDWYLQSIRFAFYFGVERTGEESAALPGLMQCLFPVEGFGPIPVSEAMRAYLPLRSEFVIFPVATMIFFFAMAFSYIRMKKEGDWQMKLMLIITALFGLASWHQYFPVPCIRHFYWAAIPMLGFYVLAMQWLQARRPGAVPARFSRIIFVVALLLPFFNIMTVAVKDVTVTLLSIKDRKPFAEPPLKYMLLTSNETRFFKSFGHVVRKMPAEISSRPCINLTNDGLFTLYFPAGEGHFPMYLDYGNSIYADYYRKIGLELEKKERAAISKKYYDIPGYRIFAIIRDVRPCVYFYLPEPGMDPKLNLPASNTKTEN